MYKHRKLNAFVLMNILLYGKVIRTYAQLLFFMIYLCHNCLYSIFFVTFSLILLWMCLFTVNFKHVLISNWLVYIYIEIVLYRPLFSVTRTYVVTLMHVCTCTSCIWRYDKSDMDFLDTYVHCTITILLQSDETNFVTRRWIYLSADKIYYIMSLIVMTVVMHRSAGMRVRKINKQVVIKGHIFFTLVSSFDSSRAVQLVMYWLFLNIL